MSLSTSLTSSIGGDIVAILFQQGLRIANDALAGAGINPISFVAGVPITVKKQESFSYEGEATQNPVEVGSIISDHVILFPNKIDINFEVSNWVTGTALLAHELFKVLRDSRTSLSLLTTFGIIPNMVLLKYNGSTSVPQWGVLTATATFQQIGLSAVETEGYTKDQVTAADETGGPDVTQSAVSAESVGTVQPKTTPLKKIWGAITK